MSQRLVVFWVPRTWNLAGWLSGMYVSTRRLRRWRFTYPIRFTMTMEMEILFVSTTRMRVSVVFPMLQLFKEMTHFSNVSSTNSELTRSLLTRYVAVLVLFQEKPKNNSDMWRTCWFSARFFAQENRRLLFAAAQLGQVKTMKMLIEEYNCDPEARGVVCNAMKCWVHSLSERKMPVLWPRWERQPSMRPLTALIWTQWNI